MSYEKKTELAFFRENWPNDYDLDGKKPRWQFFMKIDTRNMISAEYTAILFFRGIWPDGHDLAQTKPEFRFFVKFDSTTMIRRGKKPKLRFFR
jgi:hypothetical protein